MSFETRRTEKQLPIACELSEGGQRARQQEISRKLFSGCQDVKELEDGYEFVFPGNEEWAEELARFVTVERECCRFLDFELLFQANLGPVSLKTTGPDGTKEFLREQFTEELVSKHSVDRG